MADFNLVLPSGQKPRNMIEWLGYITNLLQELKGNEWYNTPDITLSEIFTALGNDKTFSETITTAINAKESPTGAQTKATAALNDAKSYVDLQLANYSASGVPKLQTFLMPILNEVEGQKTFEIPLDIYDHSTDTIYVFKNRMEIYEARGEFTVTNTVRDGGTLISRGYITIPDGVEAGKLIILKVLKNVPIGADGSISGVVISVNSMPMDRIIGLTDLLNTKMSGVSDISLLISDFDYNGEISLENMEISCNKGELLYLSTIGYSKAKANAVATTPCVGMCIETGVGVRKILKRGYIRNSAWNFTKGQALYVSPLTAGEITATKPSVPGQIVQIVGYAVESNKIYFNPQYNITTL